MSTTDSGLEELRKRVDANIAEQECAEKMRKLMRTDAQAEQEKLVGLYEESAFRARMIQFYLRNTEDCKRELRKPGISDDERATCVSCIEKHEESVEHHSKRLQQVKKDIQDLDVSQEFAEEAMGKVLDKERQNLEKDALQGDLEYFYGEYRYHRDEADLGRKRASDAEKRDSFLQKIGETEKHIAKKRRCDTNVASGK